MACARALGRRLLPRPDALRVLLRRAPADPRGARGHRPRDRGADPAPRAIRPELPEALTEAIDAALDPDPEVRPLASELEAVLAAHVNQLDGELLPAIEGPDGEPALERRRLPRVARVLPAAGVAALGLTALIATGAPAPIAAGGAGPRGPRPRPRPSRLRAAARPRSALGRDRRRRAGGRGPDRAARRSSARSRRSTRRRSPCRGPPRSSASPASARSTRRSRASPGALPAVPCSAVSATSGSRRGRSSRTERSCSGPSPTHRRDGRVQRAPRSPTS